MRLGCRLMPSQAACQQMLGLHGYTSAIGNRGLCESRGAVILVQSLSASHPEGLGSWEVHL